MKSTLRAALAALLLLAAHGARADTLIDHVEGLTPGEDGALRRFTGLIVGSDGRVVQVLGRDDRRPKKVDYLLDGKGRVVIPGLIAADADIMRLGIALLLARPSALREEGAMPAGKPRPEDLDVALAEAQEALLARGITTVTDMGTTIAEWQSFRRAGDAGTLRLRILGYAASVDDMILIAGPGPTRWLYDDHLMLGGLALGEPDALSDTQLRNLMSRAAIDRFQPAVRTPSAADIARLLDAVEELAKTYAGQRRWRAEGAQAIGPADIPRAAMLGIVALAQGGAQTGTAAPDPFAAMAAMLGRSAPEGQPLGRRTRDGALAAWTTEAAYAAFAETRLGRIAPGQRADFLFIDRDPTLATPDELADTRVLETWIDGRRVWRAGDTPQAPQARIGMDRDPQAGGR